MSLSIAEGGGGAVMSSVCHTPRISASGGLQTPLPHSQGRKDSLPRNTNPTSPFLHEEKKCSEKARGSCGTRFPVSWGDCAWERQFPRPSQRHRCCKHGKRTQQTQSGTQGSFGISTTVHWQRSTHGGNGNEGLKSLGREGEGGREEALSWGCFSAQKPLRSKSGAGFLPQSQSRQPH